jgi:cathepsin L
MVKHNKNYINDAEYAYRLGVYRQNLDFIEEHNRQNFGFSVAMNTFGDLTVNEFASIYNTYQQDNNRTLANLHVHNPLIDLAAQVDWRTKGAVTGVKNQGRCGSCWAFSTTGSTEGAAFLAGRGLTSLSEQNLVDCSRSYGNYGCDGGLMDNAFNYIVSQGIDTEASYPYTAVVGTCRRGTRGASIKGHTDVQSQSESALESAVAARPVSVAIDASHSSFQFYSSGVYYESACSSTQLDHGVLAVGYGNDQGNYWIVKNSWGAGWGSNGYILMAKGRNNNCGIATAASYPNA